MRERSTGNVVAVIDKAGRSAADAAKFAQSEHVGKILVIPGNDLIPITVNKPVQIYPKLRTTDVKEIVGICEQEKVDLAMVDQDNAIEADLATELEKKGILVIGATKEAGRIEWDKAWARLFGQKYGLPQPFFKIFSETQDAIDFLKKQPADQSWFVKAAGLAGGHGALPAKSSEEAMGRVLELRERFKDSSKVFLVEEWLRNDDGSPGEEFSTFAFVTGKTAKSLDYRIIGSAQDHKRVNNFDEGENTGGMGCSAPPLLLTSELMEDIKVNILDKTIEGLREENILYKGVLYLGGIAIRRNGKLKCYVVEFNARFGDPEAQVILPGLTNDLYEMGIAVARGDINNLEIKTDGKSRIVVAGVSKGYPGDYSRVIGKEIHGLDEIIKAKHGKVYVAGVQVKNKRYYANGGRLFHIEDDGETVVDARGKVYGKMAQVFIDGNNLHDRDDIGWRDVQRYYASLVSK